MMIRVGESALSAEHASFYIEQLRKEGHRVVTISDQINTAVVFEMYVYDDVDKLIPLIGTARHLLFFSESHNSRENCPRQIVSVSSWWEIYNYIRYEI
jgi:hypothetical protein